jgi:hypothetical protein
MAETVEEREWKLLGKQRIAATMKANWLARKRETEALRFENEAKRQRCIAAKIDMAERIKFWENLNAESSACLPTSHEHFWDNLDKGTVAAPNAPPGTDADEEALFDTVINDSEELHGERKASEQPYAATPCLRAVPKAQAASASARLAAVRQRFLTRQAAAARERPPAD